jgi:hypothetical protein
MFMFVSYPWPVPSANVCPAGLTPPAVVADPADARPDTGPLRGGQVEVEEMVSWTPRERLRLRWYRFRLAASASGRHRGSRRAQQPPLKLR